MNEVCFSENPNKQNISIKSSCVPGICSDLIKNTLLIILLILRPVSAECQTRFDIKAKSFTAEIHSPIDIVFSLKVKEAALLQDVPFGAVFTSPDKSTITVHGFYNDNLEMILRFAPTMAGIWSFTTFSSLPQLAGLQGKVESVVNSNPDIHGGVVIDPKNPQKFAYQDGQSYFALAFELDWLFALDYDNTTAIPKTTQLIDEIKANGFNQVVMNVYAYNVNWKVSADVPAAYNYKNPAYSPFRGNNENPDFTSLNIHFFKHFDRVINHLAQKGIVAHVMIYVWNKNVNWPKMYSAEDNRYFDYIVKRYQAYPNIIWDISKEALDYGRCDMPYINERIERLRRLDSYNRLVTVHDYEYCSREPDRVDFISIQNWRSDLYSLSLEAFLKHSDKPVMNIEHGGYEEGPYLSFEGNYVNPEVCVIRNYECIFAGLYSCYYWQNTSWNVVIHDPMTSKFTMKKPRFDYYKNLQILFTRYNFNSLYPYKPKLTTNSRLGPDNLASSCYPLTNGKDLYIYLVPDRNYQVNVVIPEPPSKQMEAVWFNPFTGEFRESGLTDWWIWKGYKSPWSNTYSVLILKAK